jgi:hypothetical protein
MAKLPMKYRRVSMFVYAEMFPLQFFVGCLKGSSSLILIYSNSSSNNNNNNNKGTFIWQHATK